MKVNNEIQGDFVIYGVCEDEDDNLFYIFARTPTSHVDFRVEKIKPYLFPISSMTEEQEEEYDILRDSVPTYHYEFGDVMVDVYMLLIMMMKMVIKLMFYQLVMKMVLIIIQYLKTVY